MKNQLRRVAQVAVWWGAIITGAVTTLAAGAEAVPLVKESEQSAHFTAVQKHLELGGTLYGYADIDGDVLKIADSLRGIMEQVAVAQPEVAPFLKQDLRGIFTLLGFDDIKAVGLSSVPEGDGSFRNRVFMLTPNGRHGLLAGLGGAPAPHALVKLAPTGTDFYGEAEVDLAEVYKTIKAVVTKVGGETAANLMEEKIKQAGVPASISWLDVINGWKGRSALVLRLDPEKTLALPNLVLPQPSFLLCIEGVGPAFEPMLKKLPPLKLSVVGERKIFSLAQPSPIPGINPVFVIEGKTLYLATTQAFFNECLNHKTGLAQTPEFTKALARVGATGNALAYVSPAFFDRLNDLERLNPNLPPQNLQTLRMVLGNLPKPAQPLITVRTNLPEGILIQSHWNRSLKQDVAMVAMYNPATVGLLAAMAIPAFQKVRTASQEKAVLNNLRQLAAASEQYYLENNVDTVQLDQLIGPDKYIKALNSVAGEDYSEVVLKQGEPLVVHLPDGREVRYEP
jgi:type IV pilus assembly protein PilA